jgi:hypothetical protein
MVRILAGGWVPLAGATLERLTLDDLTAKSTAIVRGKVISSYASFRGPIIYTHYEVQVSEQQGTSGSSLDVVVPGGTANNLICAQIYSGAPQLNLGGEFGWCLWTGPSGLTQIMGLTQGLFRLSPPIRVQQPPRPVLDNPAAGRYKRNRSVTC